MRKKIFIDIEATSVYPSAKILEFGYIIVDADSEPFSLIDMGHWYFTPENEVPYSSVAIHGLNKAKLQILSKNKMFYELAQQVRDKISECDVIAGYNSNFYDLTVLNNSFDNAGVKRLDPQHKTQDLCKQIPGFKFKTADNRLETVYKYIVNQLGFTLDDMSKLYQEYVSMFNVENAGTSAHGALFDTFMTMIVYTYLEENGYTDRV